MLFDELGSSGEECAHQLAMILAALLVAVREAQDGPPRAAVMAASLDVKCNTASVQLAAMPHVPCCLTRL